MQLQIENLTKSYGAHRAVDGVSYTIATDIHTLLGVNREVSLNKS